jgi:hypothetical protein
MDFKKQGAFTSQIVWGLENKPAKIFHLPIESTALNIDKDMNVDGYWYSYDWSKKYKYTPQFYSDFNGEKPENGINIIRVIRPTNEPLFPKPDWYSALRWAQDEGLMAQHSYRDIKTGFSGKKVVNWVGGRGLSDEQKNTAAKELRDKFSGIDGQDTIVSIGNTAENAVVVDNIDPPNVNATYVNYTEESERKLLIAHSYPAILLAGSKTGFSSNADEIAVATKSVFRRVINPIREIILDGLQEVFNKIDSSIILDFKDFESEELDNNGTENVIGINEQTSEQQNASAQANLRGSVGGVQSLLEIQASYAQKLTSYESAIAMINLIFGFSEDEARKLLGNPKIETPPIV